MPVQKLYNYFTLTCIHLLIIFLAFTSFIRHPFSSTLSDGWGDETKNYYALITYVKEPIGNEGIFKYNGMSYPVGDYVYYTDNTPFFSVPFRWFCHHVKDISDYTFICFNSIIIINILLCGLLLFAILRYLLNDTFFAFIMAVILPWTNVQVVRILWGHFNLSLSSLVLLAIWLLIQWHKNRDKKGKLMLLTVWMTILSVVSFLFHGYYLAIVTCFMAAMLVFYGVYNFRQVYGKLSLVAAVIYPVLSLGIALGIMNATDKYLPARQTYAMGYDWMEQKTRLTSLFSPYYFQHLFFPVANLKDRTNVEQSAYMGNIALYAILIIIIVAALNKRFKEEIIRIQKDFFKDPLKASVFLGSVVMLFISFGEHYYTSDDPKDGVEIYNILNPFFLLHQLTNRVEQFRSIGRFVWPFYFGLNLLVFYSIIRLYRSSGTRKKNLVLIPLLFLGIFELADFVAAIHMSVRKSHNYFSANETKEFHALHVNFSDYQAILPIPYFFAGSENYNYTIDDDIRWSDYAFRLSWYSGLPLMASKMSRTPPVYNKMFLKMAATDTIDNELLHRLNNKPVLVISNKKYIYDSASTVIPDYEPAKTYYWQANQFASRKHLSAIDSIGDVIYYCWYPKK